MSCVCGTLALRILQHWDRMGSKSPILKARFIGLEGRSITMVARGMGSPIPGHKEGAWVREDPKVVGGGFICFGPLIPSTWNHEGTWLRHTP